MFSVATGNTRAAIFTQSLWSRWRLAQFPDFEMRVPQNPVRRGQVCVASLCNRSKQAGCMLCGLEPFFDNSWWSVSVFAEVVNVV